MSQALSGGTPKPKSSQGGVKKPSKAKKSNGVRPSKDRKKRREQFTELAMPLADLLYATASRMLGNRDQAEDLVQETFVRAWQNFDRFELGTNFKAWIFQILTYLYLNERRSAKAREVTMDCAETSIQGAPQGESVKPGMTGADWESLYPSLVGDEFKQALERLSDDQRAILMLVTLGELSYQECADALGIPIGTVMSRLFRARKQLQSDLYSYARDRGLIGRGAE